MMNSVKRRIVFCIRDFPKGCGPNAIPNPKKNHQIEPAQYGIFDPSEGAKISGKAKEAALDSEKTINETALGEKACDLKGCVVSQRRKVWAVRDFPVGCGRGAPKIGRGPIDSKVADDGAEVGSWSKRKAEALEKAEDVETLQETRGEAIDKASKVASSSGEKEKIAKKPEDDVKRNESNQIQVKTKEAGREAKVVDDEMEIGSSMKRKTESFEKAKDDEIIGETVRETKGEVVGKALKVVSSSGEKKKKHSEKPESDVRKNESNRIQVKAKEASRENKVKSPKVEGSVRVSLEVKKNYSKKIKYDVQESGGEGRIKPFSKNSSMENIVGENREKKIEGRDGKQVEKNHHAYGDRLVVQALKSAENCPWRKGKGSGRIISRSHSKNQNKLNPN